MAARDGERRGARWSPVRALLVLASLPALLSGPALGGAAWIHAHGPSAGHVHLLPDDHDHEASALAAWHDAEHRRGHPDGEPEEEGPAPDGLRIELPELLAAAPRGSTGIPAPGLPTPAAPPSAGWRLALGEGPAPPGSVRSGWPPRGAARSGVAALLRSSHAIRI